MIFIVQSISRKLINYQWSHYQSEEQNIHRFPHVLFLFYLHICSLFYTLTTLHITKKITEEFINYPQCGYPYINKYINLLCCPFFIALYMFVPFLIFSIGELFVFCVEKFLVLFQFLFVFTLLLSFILHYFYDFILCNLPLV